MRTASLLSRAAGLDGIEGVPIPGVDPFGSPYGAEGAFDAVFGLMMTVVVIGIVVTVALAIRRGMAYHRHGIDPTTVDVEMAARLLRSQALAPERPAGVGTTPDLVEDAGPASSVHGTAEPAATAVPSAPVVRPVPERLAELDRLHESGLITAEERATARARVIAEL